MSLGDDNNSTLFQVTILLGASYDLIPQLKKKYDVDTLDMVFLDHWKDRYLPDTHLLEVSNTYFMPPLDSVLI